ncbi:hypothetical protein Acid345_1923 [Candidatus Koribacter versatilis Ellin345]|uniref:Uncharacterized protein n=1 Tax=Koribacter versatilis (strain Ellin345) TaxID=204669 RepID=Q1IQC6_KORVE|nr:hypothetical protein [Candidatus Koribacter versatilis]ABF40924.1 hypothetical protein Acid345_1923 [Candidatus Koribacter versatilis Ellin345]
MRRSFLFVSLALSLFLGSFGFAQTCVRTDILVQGGTIYTGSINRYGTVVGYFHHSDPNVPQIVGFRWNNGVFTTYQYPGATETQFAASNDKGQIAGTYGVLVGDVPYPYSHGFLYENGTFTQVDYPGAASTFLTGINNAGDLVGYFELIPTGLNHAFVKHGSTWTEIAPPNSMNASATGISNTGEVIGEYGTATDAFVFRYKNGQLTNFGPKPGSTAMWASAINKYESIVGYFENGNDFYAYTYKNGIYYTYAYPAPKGALLYTVYTGINDLGDRVGYAYYYSGATQGFVMKCR